MPGIETPDWLEAMALVGNDGGTLRLVAVDASGQLYSVAKGEDGAGTLHSLAVDTNGQLIMVPRGESGNYMTVDTNGYLTTILKGDYEGALRTVTVDDDGRLSAFVVDSSDVWEQIVKVGNAELAARLGGLPKYHRTGQVHFQDTFSGGLNKWDQRTSGAGASVELSPTYVASPGYSCKLVGGSDSDRYAGIVHNMGLLPSGKIGLSFLFSLTSLPEYVVAQFRYFDGSNIWEGWVRIKFATLKFQYYNDAGGWTNAGDVYISTTTGYTFYQMKFIVDLSLNEYVTGFVNSAEFDLSENGMYNSGATGTSFYSARIYVYSNSGDNDIAYIDDIVLTAAES